MTTKQIRLIIDSQYKNTSLAGLAASHLCTMMSLPMDDVHKIELCVIEAVNNSIKHAYQEKSGHEVEITITFSRGNVEIKVCDTGHPMDASFLEKAENQFDISDTINIEDIPENGRGLFLIKTFMDSVTYECRNKKNCLIMTKQVS